MAKRKTVDAMMTSLMEYMQVGTDDPQARIFFRYAGAEITRLGSRCLLISFPATRTSPPKEYELILREKI